MTRPSHAALVEEVADELLKEELRLPSAIARAILSLITARLSDVTPEMVEAWINVGANDDSPEQQAADDWRAMWAASPLTPGEKR